MVSILSCEATPGRIPYHSELRHYPEDERQAVIAWLKAHHEWSVERLHDHLATTYGVVFQSRQSYYQLLTEAEITYKQTQRSNPKHDVERVAAKKKRSSPT